MAIALLFFLHSLYMFRSRSLENIFWSGQKLHKIQDIIFRTLFTAYKNILWAWRTMITKTVWHGFFWTEIAKPMMKCKNNSNVSRFLCPLKIIIAIYTERPWIGPQEFREYMVCSHVSSAVLPIPWLSFSKLDLVYVILTRLTSVAECK